MGREEDVLSQMETEPFLDREAASRMIDSHHEVVSHLKHPQLVMIPAHEMLLSKAHARDDVESGPKP